MNINPCPEPFFHYPTLNLCYHLENVTGQSRTNVINNCKAHHPRAHPIALETAEEYDYMRSYVFSDGQYVYLVSSGMTAEPGSQTEWYWEISETTKKKITFFYWFHAEPNGADHPVPETYLMIRESGLYYDVSESLVPHIICSVCEYDP